MHKSTTLYTHFRVVNKLNFIYKYFCSQSLEIYILYINLSSYLEYYCPRSVVIYLFIYVLKPARFLYNVIVHLTPKQRYKTFTMYPTVDYLPTFTIFTSPLLTPVVTFTVFTSPRHTSIPTFTVGSSPAWRTNAIYVCQSRVAPAVLARLVHLKQEEEIICNCNFNKDGVSTRRKRF